MLHSPGAHWLCALVVTLPCPVMLRPAATQSYCDADTLCTAYDFTFYSDDENAPLPRSNSNLTNQDTWQMGCRVYTSSVSVNESVSPKHSFPRCQTLNDELYDRFLCFVGSQKAITYFPCTTSKASTASTASKASVPAADSPYHCVSTPPWYVEHCTDDAWQVDCPNGECDGFSSEETCDPNANCEWVPYEPPLPPTSPPPPPPPLPTATCNVSLLLTGNPTYAAATTTSAPLTWVEMSPFYAFDSKSLQVHPWKSAYTECYKRNVAV